MYISLSTVDAVEASIPAMANSAVAHCCQAWKNAYRREFESTSELSASRVAAEAYRAALPPLTSRENCRDFVACVAQGVLLEAINEKESTKLIYAAQTALSLFAKDGEPPKSAAKTRSANRRSKP